MLLFSCLRPKGLTKTSVADITAAAGVAKRHFYLYFKDKYDLRDKLIVHKSNEIFQRAEEETKSREMADLEEHIIAMIDNILNQFVEDTTLLNFIAKNLSWGIFTNAVPPGQQKKTISMSSIMPCLRIPRSNMRNRRL